MSDKPNPALEKLLQEKLDQVMASMETRYGPPLREYVWNGVYDPVLKEIGYSGKEYPKSGFEGLSKFIKYS